MSTKRAREAGELHRRTVQIAAALARVTIVEHAEEGHMLSDLRIWHGHRVRSDWGSWIAGVWTEGECGRCGGCGQVLSPDIDAVDGKLVNCELIDCTAPNCVGGRVGKVPPTIADSWEGVSADYVAACKRADIKPGILPANGYTRDELTGRFAETWWNVLSDGRVGISAGNADATMTRYVHAEYHNAGHYLLNGRGDFENIRIAMQLLEAVREVAGP